MRKRFLIGVLAAAMGACLAGPSAASAAVEFGDTCIGDDIAPEEPSYTLTTLVAPPAALPLTAPSAGVITKLKVNLVPLPFSVPTSVKVLRTAGLNTFTVVNQALVSAHGGLTVADARLPVQAGDRLGLYGEPFTYEGFPIDSLSFYCDEEPGSQLGASLGNVPSGATAAFPPATAGRVPLAAVVEPDADNDGYGDETQDFCPLSATTQVACPPVTVDASTIVGGKAVKVLVATSATAPVSVSATVKLGKGAKAKMSAKAKTVIAGKLARFRLVFPSALKERLKELEPSKKLTLKIVARATNVAGQVSTDKVNAKLKGQG